MNTDRHVIQVLPTASIRTSRDSLDQKSKRISNGGENSLTELGASRVEVRADGDAIGFPRLKVRPLLVAISKIQTKGQVV